MAAIPPQPISSQAPNRTGGLLRFVKPLTAFSVSETGRKGQLSAIDQGVISVANFAATLTLAKFVDPTQLGIYAVGFMAILFVRAIQEGLIIQPLNSLGASLDQAEFRRYASTTGLFQVILAIGSALAAVGIGWVLTSTGNNMAGPAVFSLWFGFLTWQLQEYLRRVFYTRAEIGRAVLNTVVSSMFRLALLIWLGLTGRLDGKAGLYAIGWGALAAVLIGIWQTRSMWTRKLLNLRSTWDQNWKFARWVMGGTVANWFAIQFYPILTAGMLSFAAAGAYQALQNLVAPAHVLLRASDTFLTPRIARIYHNNGAGRLRRLLKLTYLGVGLPVLGVLGVAVIFVQPLLRLIRDETYLPFSPGIWILAAFYLLWYAYWPLQTTLKAIRFTRPIFTANLLAIASMFVFGLWAIKAWGIYGTMAGQALNALIINLVLWISWKKLKK
jgi:O-antigen/teichoic acid export membrane protein